MSISSDFLLLACYLLLPRREWKLNDMYIIEYIGRNSYFRHYFETLSFGMSR